MSQTKYKLPGDLKMRCLSLVRGYKRMVALYHERRHNAMVGVPLPLDGMPRGSESGDATASTAERLEKIDALYDTQAMRAVEQAKFEIGSDIDDDAERLKLMEAVWDSCIEGRNFIFEYRNLCVGKTNFYERRRKFLYTIAKNMGFF